jgi:hypothetical protein
MVNPYRLAHASIQVYSLKMTPYSQSLTYTIESNNCNHTYCKKLSLLFQKCPPNYCPLLVEGWHFEEDYKAKHINMHYKNISC